MRLPPESASRVTLRRAQQRLSFRQAASKSGLAVGTWQRAEAGQGIEYQSLVAIVEALGWPASAAAQLVDGVDPDGRPPTPGAAVAVEEEFGFAAIDGQPLTEEERRAAIAVVRGLRSSR